MVGIGMCLVHLTVVYIYSWMDVQHLNSVLNSISNIQQYTYSPLQESNMQQCIHPPPQESNINRIKVKGNPV